MDGERRRHARYSRGDMTIEIARPGILGILTVAPSAECDNFSRSGLQFCCEKPFEIGEKLIRDICAFNILGHELSAAIVNITPCEDNKWCCHVRFCFEDKHMQDPDLQLALLQIEDRLRTAQAYPFTPTV
ncbi:MAG: hypothetical protein HUJ31_19635 [Pseudomonadales bacterium]|nr:hypothetical protein [Pseudomonadales bacterium]